MENFTNNIKKSLIVTSLVGLVVSMFSGNVHAASSERSNLYVGVGVGYNRFSLSNDYKNKINAAPNKGHSKSSASNLLAPLIGVKYQDNYGAELGYALINKLSFDGVSGGHLRLKNYFIDLMGYMPLDSSAAAIDLLGGLGIGRMIIKEKSTINAMGNGGSYNKFGFRFKCGAQYLLDNHWSLRGLFSYQVVGGKDNKQAVKSIQSVGMDVVYLL